MTRGSSDAPAVAAARGDTLSLVKEGSEEAA
jgi:hypothetical protein